MKKLNRIIRANESHWVGDGFPVRTLFSYNTPGIETSPFLLMDYAGPAYFPPASKPRGVGLHPHRGFETVTLLYQGEVEHQDTAGNGGLIGPGDVQWMTAAKGVLHQEMHSAAFTRQGGTFEAVQLWVNLPAAYKMTDPHYQTLIRTRIPSVKLDDKGSLLRVIAGHYGDTEGPARTHTPINLWDMRIAAGQTVELSVHEDYTTLLFALKSDVLINGGEELKAAKLAYFDRSGSRISIAAGQDAALLLMNGAPIDEPIAGYGPFVMNTQEEIRQAMADFNDGRFR
ncbi:MAG: pirin family protein [Gammaproteobacteria bacterium]